MTHAIDKTVGQIAGVIGLITITLFPLWMLPNTYNFYDINKLTLLIIATCILLILYAIRTIITKTLRLELVPLLTPVLLFGLIHFISPFISTPQNVVGSLMGRAGFFFILSLFVIAIVNLVQERKFIRQATYALIGSATILSIITLFQSFGFGLSSLINQFSASNLPNTLAFSPAGNIIALLSFLIPITALSLVLAFTKTDAAEKVSLFILSAIIASSILVIAVYSMPGKETSIVLLPFQTGYAVAIDTLKLPQTAIFGVGTDSFSSAYNVHKPSAINLTNLWNIRFATSSTEILHLITTIGLTGLLAFLYIIISMFKLAKISTNSIQVRSLKVAAFTIAILFFIIPGSFVHYFAFAVILSLWALAAKFYNLESIRTLECNLNHQPESPQTIKKIGVYVPSLLIIGLAAALLFLWFKVYLADIAFRDSLKATTKNDGLAAYNLQRKAILQNPYLPLYRRAYASTNLALANSLAGKTDITDQDKQNIAQLIQQSIREAKIAANIEPNNVSNWETLATIYRALINAADGADQWTVAALSQAIQVDPVNPALRVELGGIYYSLAAYDQSIRLFQQAAELKPDYANAYYNLSHAYLQKKDIGLAYDYMRQTLSLVPTDSADYTKSMEELETLSQQLPKQKAGTEVVAPAATNLQTAPPTSPTTTEVNLPTSAGPDNFDSTSPSIPANDLNP